MNAAQGKSLSARKATPKTDPEPAEDCGATLRVLDELGVWDTDIICGRQKGHDGPHSGGLEWFNEEHTELDLRYVLKERAA